MLPVLGTRIRKRDDPKMPMWNSYQPKDVPTGNNGCFGVPSPGKLPNSFSITDNLLWYVHKNNNNNYSERERDTNKTVVVYE